MYIHVKVRLEKFGQVGKSFRKSRKKFGKVEKIIHKNVTSCPSRREKIKNFGTFPREQRPERGLRLPRVFLNSPQLLTNGPTPHRDSIHRQPSRWQMVRM